MKLSTIIFTAIIFAGLILLGLNNLGIGSDSGATLRASIGSILTVGGAIIWAAKELIFTRD